MAYGLIKDTTLTAIADGLRSKGIVDGEPITQVVKSKYATGFDTPASSYSYSDNICTVVTIAGAPNIEVDFAVGGMSPDEYAQIVAGSYDESTFPTDATKYVASTENYVTNRTRYLVKVENTDTVTIRFRHTKVGSSVSFYAEVRGYDIDGNYSVTKVTPSQMVEAINSANPVLPTEALTITGDCSYMDMGGSWDWFFETYGNQIKTQDISTLNNMFTRSNITQIPFTINVAKNCYEFNSAFSYCQSLVECPKIRGLIINASSYLNVNDILKQASNLTDVEDLFDADEFASAFYRKVTSAYSCSKPSKFENCYKLRKAPSWFYKQILHEDSTVYPSSSSFLYSYLFQNCYCLDEITNIPVWRCSAALTSNTFNSALNYINRAKEVTFETQEDGSPITTQWKSQTIDLTYYVGYGTSANGFKNRMPDDKVVTDDTTYQALKDDPDWWTYNAYYSRYNHDSAVNTINSLPDTSAYLATAGGTNTIKFKGASGSSTDGGAINTLTEEEIAVATAKGWTVTIS